MTIETTRESVRKSGVAGAELGGPVVTEAHACPECGYRHADLRTVPSPPAAGRTPGTSDSCEYAWCMYQAAVGELRGHYWRDGNLPWALCEVHLQPSAHPPDLRDKLVRWQ